MGSVVRVIPLSLAELARAYFMVERAGWELSDAVLGRLVDLGLSRRRLYLVRDATGPWLFDVIEGSRDLITLGPEAVWAATGCELDRWIAARADRAYVGDLESLPDAAPALELQVPLDAAVGHIEPKDTAEAALAPRSSPLPPTPPTPPREAS